MTATPVCAHMNLGPHVHVYQWCSTIASAVDEFYRQLEKFYGTVDKSIAEIRGPDEMPCVDLYAPACPVGQPVANWEGELMCNREMNFHDYPMARYQVGPRGGIRKVSV